MLSHMLLSLLDEFADSVCILAREVHMLLFIRFATFLPLKKTFGKYLVQWEKIWHTRFLSSLSNPLPFFILAILISRTPAILPTNTERPTIYLLWAGKDQNWSRISNFEYSNYFQWDMLGSHYLIRKFYAIWHFPSELLNNPRKGLTLNGRIVIN